MRAEPTTTVWELWALAAAVGARGGDPAEFFAALGLEPATLGDPETRVPHATAVAAWEHAPRLAHDEDLGLHLAEAWSVGAFDVVEYCLRSQRDLGAAFQTLVRYQRVMHEAAEFTVERHGTHVRIRRTLPARLGPPPRHASEFVLAFMVTSSRRGTGRDFAPVELRFAHPAPRSTREHARLFRAPVRFGMPHDELVLDASLLELPMLAADSALGAVLERQVRAMLERLPATDALSERVRAAVCSGLARELPSAPALARRLGLSARSLHRKLRDEGTSYLRIVDEVRRELALRHVDAGTLPLAEVAFVLGFSETSAFHRAFRRWTGQSPIAYRRARATG